MAIKRRPLVTKDNRCEYKQIGVVSFGTAMARDQGSFYGCLLPCVVPPNRPPPGPCSRIRRLPLGSGNATVVKAAQFTGCAVVPGYFFYPTGSVPNNLPCCRGPSFTQGENAFRSYRISSSKATDVQAGSPGADRPSVPNGT